MHSFVDRPIVTIPCGKAVEFVTEAAGQLEYHLTADPQTLEIVGTRRVGSQWFCLVQAKRPYGEGGLHASVVYEKVATIASYAVKAVPALNGGNLAISFGPPIEAGSKEAEELKKLYEQKPKQAAKQEQVKQEAEKK